MSDLFSAPHQGEIVRSFAPGATGNVASEDLAWMFERMGISTGIDVPALAALGDVAAAFDGAEADGRVKAALACRRTA